ncbi:MAG TPA: PDZ domain-containing protein [Methylophilaceae bacterium]|jgi:hypothetical protein
MMRRPNVVMLLCGMVLQVLTAQADESANPFARAYRPLELRAPLQSEPVEPQIFRGTEDREGDYRRMLVQGYDLIGRSSFIAGDVPIELLMQHARTVRAHAVLVTTRRSGEVPASVRMEQLKRSMREQGREITDQSMLQPAVSYAYDASYWAKLVPPVLGLHVRPPTERESPQGLVVIAVIRNSPAERAGLQAQDTVLRVGDVALDRPELLSQAVNRHAGKTVELTFLRDGEVRKTEVHLNPQR